MQKTQEMFDPWVGKISWRRKRQPTPVFLPEKSCGQRNLVDYSLKGHKVRLNWVTKHTHVFQGLSSLTRNWTRTLAMNVQRWTRPPEKSLTILYLISWGTAILFSRAGALFYISVSNVQWFQLPNILPKLLSSVFW